MKKILYILLIIAVIISLTDTWGAVVLTAIDIFGFAILIGIITLTYYILFVVFQKKDKFKDTKF